jgi:hypothetical protein
VQAIHRRRLDIERLFSATTPDAEGCVRRPTKQPPLDAEASVRQLLFR